MNKIFGTLLLALFVVACAAPAQTPTGFVIIPATSTVVRPTATITPATTPTAQPTLALSPTPKPKPTQEPLKTTEHRAPNGWWSAQGWGEFRGETYHAELRVTRADGQVSWVASQDTNAGLGVPLPTPLEWSQDGRYLYYTNVPLVDGYTCSIPVNGSDLWRMDLSDGSALQLVPEVGLAVSLSPDEQTFAYVSFGPQQNLVLRDLATGEERRAPLPADTQAGGIVWSLDSSVLMLTMAEGPCSGGQEEHTIMRVDVETLEQTAVPIENDGIQWITLEWDRHGQVLLTDYKGHSTWLNPATNKLEEAGSLGKALASPDLKWMAVTLENMDGNARMEVIRTVGPQTWMISQEYLLGYLVPLRWTPEGRYLYFTLAPSLDGCGAWPFKGKDLYRLDVETGKTVEVTHNVWVRSISPNSKWLVYVEDKDLVIFDLTTSVEQRKTLDVYGWGEFVEIGNFIWAPDNKSLLMAVELDSCTEIILSSVVQIDRSTLKETVLIRDVPQRFRVMGWIDGETVWLRDDAGYGNYWLFNPLTGELTIPTLVPQNLRPN